ncbi:MAG TPA: histidine kinase [Chitinophagaceae bacterium]|nr:histidine kinase [Chitinophagaceae bacterium]
MKKSWYSYTWVKILLHIAVWIIVFSLPFLLFTSYHNDKPHTEQRSAVSMFYIGKAIMWIVFFYINSWVLIPAFIYKKKYWQFLVMQLLVWVGIFGLDYVLFISFPPFPNPEYHFQSFIISNLFPYLFFLASSIAFQMIQDRIQMDKLAKEKENENLKTELAFLRSQVSPHFMFNVLNNMVSLARKQSEQLEPSLIKLSSLMRYMLYETDEEKVPLEREIEYLQSYIDLQQQRFGKKVKVTVSLKVGEGHYELEPMLLIPFVENAFKHGTGMIEDAQIDISLKAENNILNFTVRNKYNEESKEVKDKTSGIGLTNVKRRLSLLYGKNHNLWLTAKDNWFLVSLQINMH